MKHSKRYSAVSTKIDSTKALTLADGIALIKESPVKFDAGVEIHVRLGIDPSKSDQIVRGTVVLPHGSGKTKKVIAFVPSSLEADAKAAGADIIGTDDVINEIKNTGKCSFDVAVATPDMMKKIGVIAKILGQQGLMPSPKTETVGTDVKKMISELKGGKVAYRCDDGANVHLLVGRVSFAPEQLTANITAAIESITKAKPSESKGIYLKSVVIASSMGPGIKVSL
ncbi:MAG: 50S ribosomal protein L1 [Candidatus Kerfeldbacteria bacterium]|nr:50S ribosomal protein L1 [Candidatus Kerfeldbacteria bacterium]